MRIFLAIPLLRDYLQKIAEYQQGVDLRGCGRWVPPRNLHVTVFFLGEVAEQRLPELKDKLQKVTSQLKSFELLFKSMDFRLPKMIWASFQFNPVWKSFWEKIAKVAREFAESSFDRQKQLPHITVARLKSIPKNKRLPALNLPSLPVNRVELWRSQLSPQGAIYRSLASFPLQENFTERVQEVVRQIPKGKVLTYAEVARLTGSPKAVRAVGNILKHNFDPTIPCHRVIRSDGSVGEYNRGAEKKVQLLRKEGVKISRD
ncbi:MAG: RNA 2',3'-cyclic phosphodiesterase [Patescibacteria group bacterium]